MKLASSADVIGPARALAPLASALPVMALASPHLFWVMNRMAKSQHHDTQEHRNFHI